MELIPTVTVESRLSSELKQTCDLLGVEPDILPENPEEREEYIAHILEVSRDYIEETELKFRLKEIEARQQSRLLDTIARMITKQAKPAQDMVKKKSVFTRYWRKKLAIMCQQIIIMTTYAYLISLKNEMKYAHHHL